MGFDISNPGLRLSLGLGLNDHSSENRIKISDEHKPSQKKKAYPSLTLGPQYDDEANYNNQQITKAESDEYCYFDPRASSLSAVVSSFSNSSSIKREREQFAGEELDLEIEKIPSRIVDVDENGSLKKKLRLTKQQSAILEDNFREHSTLSPKQKQELAKKLNLRTRQVEVWFQNRRARTKLKQTEVDCEIMKKCCETLSEENKMLQKELQELKSMKTTVGPFYMQLPVASLTICPSCERICGGTNNGSSPTTALHVNSKDHKNFYKNNYTFTQSSAAC